MSELEEIEVIQRGGIFYLSFTPRELSDLTIRNVTELSDVDVFTGVRLVLTEEVGGSFR